MGEVEALTRSGSAVRLAAAGANVSAATCEAGVLEAVEFKDEFYGRIVWAAACSLRVKLP
jgi:hypothetical protein